MILVSWWKCDGGAISRRYGECLHIKDAANGGVTLSIGVGLHIGLIPGNAKGLIGDLDHEKIIPGVGSKSCNSDFHFIIERLWLYGHVPCSMRKAGFNARGGDHIEFKCAYVVVF